MSVVRDYVEAGRGHIRKAVLLAWLRPRASGLVRIGSDYGGKWIPSSILRQDAVAYCAGAGEDVSFDLALADAGLRVSTFDPTPRAVAHVNELADRARALRFVPVGWWDEDTVLRFYSPLDSANVSHSVINPRNTNAYFEARVKSPRQLMLELGDDHVDLVKMDIEGAELRVIPSILDSDLRPEVIIVEFDQPQRLRGMAHAIRLLRHEGYQLVKIDRWDFTFLLDH